MILTGNIVSIINSSFESLSVDYLVLSNHAGDPMDCSLPRLLYPWIFQVRITLTWIVIPLSSGSFWPWDWSASCIAGRFYCWVTRKPNSLFIVFKWTLLETSVTIRSVPWETNWYVILAPFNGSSDLQEMLEELWQVLNLYCTFMKGSTV